MLRFRTKNWEIRLTRSGVMTGLISIWLLAASLQAQVNLLLIFFGLGIGGMAAALVLPLASLRGLSAERRVPARVPRGSGLQVIYRLKRLGRFWPAFGLEIREAEIDGADAAWQPRAWAPWLGAGGETTVRWSGQAGRRGIVTFHAIEVATQFPFGLWEVIRRFKQQDLLRVVPRTDQAGVVLRAARHPAGSRRPRRRLSASQEEMVVGLRPYRSGDDFRQIHWKATARRGVPVAREMAAERREGLSLCLDLRGAVAGASSEQAIEEAATLLQQANSAGWPVQFRILGSGEREKLPAGMAPVSACLDVLCELQLGEAGKSVPDARSLPGADWQVVRLRSAAGSRESAA